MVVVKRSGAEPWLPWLTKLAFYPALAIISLCALVMAVELVVKFVRDRRRRNRRRLSSRNLRKIPTKKYKKGEEPETCPICLDDFDDGEKLRILPCNHAYHCKCVDPWLTKNRKVCPVCKRKVCPSKDDSESETEQPTNSSNPDPTSSADDTQLIPEDPESRPVGNSTFFEAAEPRGFLHRVVPGFLRRDQIARPPPPDPEEDEEDEGMENPGFHQLPDPEEVAVRSAPRRKRHPAHRKNLPRAANTTIRLEESEEESSPGAVDVPRARTHKPPPPEALSRGRRPPVPSTSAPPILPQPSSDEEEGPQESTRVGREDSIQLDMGPIDLQAGPHRLA